MERIKAKRKRSKIRSFLKILCAYLFFLGIALLVFYQLNKNISLIRPVPSGAFVASDPISKNVSDLLSKNKIPFSSVSLATNSAILVVLKEDQEVLLSSKNPLPLQISSLQLVLSRLTIEGKRFERLDFRFDKPIIVLGN